MKKLGIVTINYNNLAGLQKTFDSIFSQIDVSFNYYVIDGGSNDGSKELIIKNADKITYWVSEKDAGIYDALNKGINICNDEYIVFMNSGDYYLFSDSLKKCLTIINNNDADIFYGQIIYENNNKDFLVSYPEKISLKYLKDNVLNHQACFIKLSTLKDHNGYDKEYTLAADYNFIILAYINGAKFVPILFPIVRYDLTGISRLKEKEYEFQMKKIWNLLVPNRLLELENKYFEMSEMVANSNFLKLIFKMIKFKNKVFKTRFNSFLTRIP